MLGYIHMFVTYLCFLFMPQKIAFTESSFNQLLNLAEESGKQMEIYDSAWKGPGSFGIRLNVKRKRTFFYIYRINGRRKRLSLGCFPSISLVQARNMARLMAQAVTAGRDPAEEKRQGKSINSLGDLWCAFLRSPEAERLKGKTRAEYCRIMESEIFPLWRDRPAAHITPVDVSDLLREISSVRQHPVLANRTRSLLHRLFNFALERPQTLVVSNPVQNAPRAQLDPLPFRKIPDMTWLLSYWKTLHKGVDNYHAAAKMLLLTGLPPGQLLKLRWQDISLDRCYAGVDAKALTRAVPLSKLAIQVLQQVSSNREGRVLVFSRLSSNSPLSLARWMRGQEVGYQPRDIANGVWTALLREGCSSDVVSFVKGGVRCSEYGRNQDDLFDKARAALESWSFFLSNQGPPPSLPSNVISLASARKSAIVKPQ